MGSYPAPGTMINMVLSTQEFTLERDRQPTSNYKDDEEADVMCRPGSMVWIRGVRETGGKPRQHSNPGSAYHVIAH